MGVGELVNRKNGAFGLSYQAQDAARVIQERFACWRQGDAAVAAHKKVTLQAGLQITDMLADGRLSQEQMFGCLAEAAIDGNSIEDFKLV